MHYVDLYATLIAGLNPLKVFTYNIHMTPNETFNTLQTAIQRGGTFSKKLAEAALVADADNKALIFRTWPRLITQYGPSSTLYVGNK